MNPDYWERDYTRAFGPGREFKPRPIIVEFQDSGETIRLLVDRGLFDRLVTESRRMHMEYERRMAAEAERERRVRMREEQEEMRREEERRRKMNEQARVYMADASFKFDGVFVDHEYLRSLFDEVNGAFRNFTFTTSNTSGSTSYDFRSSSMPKTEHKTTRDSTPPPRPPKREVPKAWTRDQLINRLCQLARLVDRGELTDKQLYRRAMRFCHPDAQGSHDLWLELDELKQLLRI